MTEADDRHFELCIKSLTSTLTHAESEELKALQEKVRARREEERNRVAGISGGGEVDG
jgi:hypothetical protein